MARRYMGPRYEVPQRSFGNAALDALLKDASGAITGYQTTYPDGFDLEVEAIEANEELSPVGKQRALNRIVNKFENLSAKRDIADKWIERAEAEAARLEAEVSKRPSRGDTQADQIGFELRMNRTLLDFRALDPAVRREKVREAIDKAATSERARELLFGLIDDGLLDEQNESRARAALSASANPAAARALDALLGTTDYTGKRDPSSGALSVAKFAREQYHQYIRERAGLDLSLEQLVEQHQVPKPVMQGTVMRLSRAAASNAAIFRAAEAEAQSKRLTLQVEPVAASPFTNSVAENGEE